MYEETQEGDTKDRLGLSVTALGGNFHQAGPSACKSTPWMTKGHYLEL